VRDDEHRFTRVGAGDLVERRNYPRGHLLRRLPVPPRSPASLREALEGHGVGEAFPGAEMLLSESLVDLHRELSARREDRRGLDRAGEVARVERVDAAVQRLGEASRLFAACFVERHVGVTLDPPVPIPVGFAVPDEEYRRRHVGYRSRMDLELADKVAVVTGSSRGIGQGIATRLVQEGAHVVFCARGQEQLDAAVTAAAGPGKAVALAADVSTADGAERVVAAAVHEFGGLDIVVNNVGGSGARTVADMDGADLDAVLDKNLFSALHVSRASLPHLRARQGGVIAIVSSVYGREAGGGPSYNVAKAAEISLAKAMARDLARDRIRVFSVAPGSVRFPGGSWDRRMLDDPEATTAFVEREIPWGRFGTVNEVADVVTFLVSPRASWVTGACVPIDGGQSRAF